jgi:hypothetical protein
MLFRSRKFSFKNTAAGGNENIDKRALVRVTAHNKIREQVEWGQEVDG